MADDFPTDFDPLETEAQSSRLTWSQVWQVPVLLVGMVMLGVGIYLALPRHELPDYPAMLDTVQEYLRADNLDEARIRLDLLADEGATDPLRADASVRSRYHHYLGDFQYLDYKDLYEYPVDTPQSRELLEKTVSAYEVARTLGREVTGESPGYWSEALVLLGRDREALNLVDQMPEATHRDRYRVLKTLIQRQRDRGPDGLGEPINRLLTRFDREIRQDPNAERRLRERQWLAEVRSAIYLDVGDPQQAIDYINREMQRLRAAGAEDDPKLLVLLAEAYQAIADFEAARRLYAAAQQRIERGDPLNATILVGLGQIELNDGGEGFEDRALALFSRAAREYPLTPAYLDALIGRAHVEAMMGQVSEALDNFRLAVAQVIEHTRATDPRREDLTLRIAAHIDHAIDVQRYQDALDYLTLMLPMYGNGRSLPPALLLQFAQVHEQIAGKRKADAEALDPLTWQGDEAPSEAARRQAFQESAIHFAESAGYYQRHAGTVTLIDPHAHGKSLWAAGTNYDNAQQWDKAINIYAEFVDTRPNDGDLLKARFHLGQAYMADRQYETAIDLFNQLIADNPQSNWAYAALVPLARSYTSVGQNDAALRTLLSIVDGHPSITPDSETYQDALIDLARTYYLLGQEDPVYFVSAIERLNTAVERYGNTQQGPILRYMLADSLRRSSAGLNQEADHARSQRQRLAFQAERDKRLREAEMYYDQVITELEARFEAARSPLETLYLRNAYFFKADCAYARSAYEVAIERYREAAQRWSEHPASLVAQVQIVNAYCELGEFQQAFVANQNALWQLAQMPDEVFDSPDMPMTRRHWEDWLRWSSELKLLDSQTADAAP
jgi:tetratricopeptide (TPR) repeat protein